MFPTYKNLMRLLNSVDIPKRLCYQFIIYVPNVILMMTDRQGRYKGMRKNWKEGERMKEK
jgi:hypothetical protein